MGWEDFLLQPQTPRDTGYQGYFDNYMNQYAPRDQSYFFDMKDPEVQRYQEMSAEAPRSKGFIEDYLSRRPSLEEYNPSFGRKLGAFALGTLSGLNNPGLAYQNAQRVRMDPYQSQLTDWQAEGQGINARAKALDDAQKNELNAQKFGLVERAKAAMNAERAKRDTLSGATRTAGSIVSGQNTADRIENDKYNRLMEILLRQQSQAALEASRRNADSDRDARLQFDREKFDWLKSHPKESAHDSRMSDPTELLKQRAGAESLAIKDIEQDPNNAVFVPLIKAMRAARESNQNPMEVIDSYDFGQYPFLKDLFKQKLAEISKRYMGGR